MRALLDVNMLVALLDSDHVHHTRALQWMDTRMQHGWASCPLTQNGCIRIMSQSSYPNTNTPNGMACLLRKAINSAHHQFWTDNQSLLDEKLINWENVLYSRQLTDTYLLGLAVRRGGMLVTLDGHIKTNTVHGATHKNLLVL
jgi:toxin-antitoxin system PIN domain toxin